MARRVSRKVDPIATAAVEFYRTTESGMVLIRRYQRTFYALPAPLDRALPSALHQMGTQLLKEADGPQSSPYGLFVHVTLWRR